jgi:hypothetical protein
VQEAPRIQHPPKFLNPWPAEADDAGLVAELGEIAPHRPSWINPQNAEQLDRWEVCARVAAAAALYGGRAAGADLREMQQFAWFAARACFESDIPTGSPEHETQNPS